MPDTGHLRNGGADPRCGVRPYGADDVALRRWADIIERIAGDQRERPSRRWIEHRYVLRVDDPGPFDAIDFLPSKRFELDGIFGPDVLQASKEPVAVPGDSGVAIRPRQCRVVDVTHGAVEREVVGAQQDRHLEANLRDAQDRERWRCGFAQCPPPGGDAFRVPEAQVRYRGPLERRRLEERKPLELVPSARGAVDVQRAARHQAHKPERPRSAFHEQTETALPYPIDGRSSLHSLRPPGALLRGERPDAATA